MRLLLAAVLVSVSSLVACGGGNAATPDSHMPGDHDHKAGAPSADLKEPGDAKVGDKTRCPVSGEEFTVSATQPKVEYNGKTYYTCCSGCQKKLEADPAKYLKPKT